MEETVRLRKQLKRTRVVAFILIVFSAMCLVYGQVQRMEAERERELSVQQKEIAEQAMAEAQRQEAMAAQSRAEAERQRMLAEENAAIAAASKQKKK